MKLSALFTFFFLFCVSFSNSQQAKDALLLQSGTVYPDYNLDSFLNEEVNEKEIADGYYYRIIQFNDFPSKELKEKIQLSGIILNSYLPYHSYNCAIPAGIDKTIFSDLNVHSILKWTSHNKVHPNIAGNNFPSHAIKEKGKVDLVIHYQKNISETIIPSLFAERGIQIIDLYKSVHTLTVRVSFEKFDELIAMPSVYFIEPISLPSKKDDTEGRSLHRSNVINSDYATGLHYDGSGVSVAIADDGAIGPHIDFTGRVTDHVTSGLGGGHGDMTSGICVGAGNLDPNIRGMATGANLHVFSINSYPQIINAEANFNNYQTVIVSTSYAQDCNEYNSDSEFGDQLILENSEFSFCFSAGNEGTTDCSYGAGNLWGNITGGYKLGKNVIACGNLNAYDELQNSSSRGPARDGRIKPDICSNGAGQLSTEQDNTYQVGGGTSAACPGVAGVLAQLYQAYKEITGQSNPPGALMKECILNSADDLGNEGPDFKHGWGRINAFRALKTIENHRYLNDSIDQGENNVHSIAVPSDVKQLRVMLYWSDIPGSPSSAKSLVNDLNMVITTPATTSVNPWVLDPAPLVASLNSPAVRGIDSLNNVEQITIDNPASGNYIITVNGFQVPIGSQTYYITYEFLTDSVHVTYPNGGEGFYGGESQIIRWDAYGNTGNFNIDYSSDNGGSWNSIVSGLAINERSYQWILPSVISDEMKLRITRNSLTDITDTSFTIIDVPHNLDVTFSCIDSIGLEWAAVTGASAYEVSMLGAKYMDSIGTTTSTHFTIFNLNPLDDHWFSVRALAGNGGKGQKAYAINKLPGLENCPLAIDGSITEILNPATGTSSDCLDSQPTNIVVKIKNPGLTAISNFDIYFSINGNTSNETYNGTIAAGDSVIYTFTQSAVMATGANYFLNTWISLNGDLNINNDTTGIEFHIISGNDAISFSESFETMTLCSTNSDCESTSCTLLDQWQNVNNGNGDDIDWRINEGTTPSSGTGPDTDHTLGSTTGKYIYLEASSCTEKEAVLLSPCFDLDTLIQPTLTFWYHMFGADMGDLHVDVITKNRYYEDYIPVVSGNQGNFWLMQSQSLNQFAGEKILLRFRGITKDDFAGDMALDDIQITGLTTGIQEAQNAAQFYVYPNPGKGLFNFRSINNYNTDGILVIEDVLGKVILEKSLHEIQNNGTGTIDLSSNASGVYYATFRSDKSTQQVVIIKL